MYDWTKKVKKAVHIDLLSQIWSAVSGLVTVLLIWKYFSLETQGKYYLILNAIFVKTLFDFGILNFVVQSFENNFSSRFRNGGPQERLIAIAAFKGYQSKFRNVIFRLSALSFGAVFCYLQFAMDGIGIKEIIISIIVATFLGVDIVSAYFSGMLVYYKYVDLVFKTRLIQAVVFSGALWFTLVLGFEELSVAFAIVCSSTFSFSKLYLSYHFVRPKWIYEFISFENIAIKKTKFLFMKSMLSQAIASILNALIIPLTTVFFGLETTGRIGLGLYVVLLFERFGMSLLTSRYIEYCRLSSEGKYSILDRKVAFHTLGALMLSAVLFACFLFILWLMHILDYSIRARFPSIGSLCFLMGTFLGWLAIYGIKLNLRANNEEDFFLIHLVILLSFLILCYFQPFVNTFTEVNYLAFLFCSVALIGLPVSVYIWFRKRKVLSEATG